MHLLRTVSPRLISTMARLHDSEIINTFEKIIGYDLSKQQQQQLTLRIKNGGFGLTASSDTSTSAFLEAWANTLNNLGNRDKRLVSLCNNLTDTFVDRPLSLAGDLNEALEDHHTSCTTTEPLVPSLQDLSNCSKKLQSRLQSIKKTNSSINFYRTALQEKIEQD